jgi:septal ring factor EnvC (AmiA/AmiB activator)
LKEAFEKEKKKHEKEMSLRMYEFGFELAHHKTKQEELEKEIKRLKGENTDETNEIAQKQNKIRELERKIEKEEGLRKS